jgi:hypothetical protein
VFSDDGRLYITLANSIARVKILTKPIKIMNK